MKYFSQIICFFLIILISGCTQTGIPTNQDEYSIDVYGANVSGNGEKCELTIDYGYNKELDPKTLIQVYEPKVDFLGNQLNCDIYSGNPKENEKIRWSTIDCFNTVDKESENSVSQFDCNLRGGDSFSDVLVSFGYRLEGDITDTNITRTFSGTVEHFPGDYYMQRITGFRNIGPPLDWIYYANGDFYVTLRNNLGEPIEISSVTASCGINLEKVTLDLSGSSNTVGSGNMIEYKTNQDKCQMLESGSSYSVMLEVTYTTQTGIYAIQETGTLTGTAT